MYEDKTFENIMEDMMEEVEGEDFDKSEGSLIWNACAKMAAQLEEAYEAIANTYDNIMVDTMDIEHLITFGTELGIPVIEATTAVFKLETNCEFDIGESFEHTEQDLTYTIIEVIDADNYIYKVECDEPGSEPNKYLGEVEPEEYKEEFETGELTLLLTAGTDEEDEEHYRERLMNTWETRSFAGNRNYYVERVNEIDGVGAVKAYRIVSGQNTVRLMILDSGYNEPTQELLASVQEEVDPTTSPANGDGMAPIGARVLVQGASTETISVEGTIELTPDTEFEDIESMLEAAVDDYFYTLASKWEESNGQVVRRAQVEVRVAAVEGVIDVTSITLNGSAANITLDADTIAKRGVITWTTL